MSERGSFVTEYIYCQQCFDACREVLCENEKYLKGVVIPSWTGEGNLPIIAGKIGGTSMGEEFIIMKYELIPEIQEKMCADCNIRIAVLSDACGTLVYRFNKNEIEERKVDDGIER